MRFSKGHKFLLVLLIGLGTLAQASTMVRSGLLYDFGLGFWGPNGHDGVWHLALANQVLRGFPPPHPNFSGAILSNYHLFFDYLLALSSKFTGLPISLLYFQVFPVFFAVLLGLFSFLLGYCWRKDFWTGFWLAFFNYFAGSFGYLVTFLRGEGIGGESMFWSMQSISTLINPPFALSILVLFSVMLILPSLKKDQPGKLLAVSFLLGMLIIIKSYSAIVAFAGLCGFLVFKLVKKENEALIVLPLSLTISLILFLASARGSADILVLKPFWFINSMIDAQDRLYLPSLSLARVNGPLVKRLTVGILGLAIFAVGNLGSRLLGLIDLAKRWKKTTGLDFFLLTGGLTAFLIPLLFIQKGTAWNTIQFFYYFLFFANFYAAGFFSWLTRKKGYLSKTILVVLVFLTIPTTISSLKGYFGWPPPASLPKGELQALEFLRQQPKGIVLTFPFSPFEKNSYSATPLPLRVYAPTAYVSAFSGQQTFLEETNLDILGYDWQERKESILDFFSTDEVKGEFLVSHNIRYVYLVKAQGVRLDKGGRGLKKIFENQTVVIFELGS